MDARDIALIIEHYIPTGTEEDALKFVEATERHGYKYDSERYEFVNAKGEAINEAKWQEILLNLPSSDDGEEAQDEEVSAAEPEDL